MKTKNGFFESLNGNRSSSRLIGFLVVLIALFYVGIILFIGKENIVTAATASGLLFTTIAGPAMVFLFAQKRTEGTQEKNE